MKQIYLLFNRQTKEFVSYIVESIDGLSPILDHLIVKKVDVLVDEFNLAQWKVEGNAGNFKLIDLFQEKKAIVTEDEINKKYYGIFFRKYKIEEVLFSLLSDNDELRKMKNFVQTLNYKKVKEIEFYKDSKNHYFEDNKFQEERQENTFKI